MYPSQIAFAQEAQSIFDRTVGTTEVEAPHHLAIARRRQQNHRYLAYHTWLSELARLFRVYCNRTRVYNGDLNVELMDAIYRDVRDAVMNERNRLQNHPLYGHAMWDAFRDHIDEYYHQQHDYFHRPSA